MFTAIIVAGLGLIFGSFTNALLWRLKQQEGGASTKTIKSKKVDLSITTGRSVCVKCGHELGPLDLVPFFSWLLLRGRCRYCKKKIDDSPLIELAMAALFFASYQLWPYEISSTLQWGLFGTWLALVVGFVALFVYDVRWMLLPNRVMYPLFGVALVYWLLASIEIDLGAQMAARELLLGLGVGGGLFYLLYQISDGRWIGGGDVKLGWLMGIILGPLYVGVALLTSFYAAAFSILPLMLIKKVSRKSKIPFGPFMIAGLFVAVFYGNKLVEFYRTLSGL